MDDLGFGALGTSFVAQALSHPTATASDVLFGVWCLVA